MSKIKYKLNDIIISAKPKFLVEIFSYLYPQNEAIQAYQLNDFLSYLTDKKLPTPHSLEDLDNLAKREREILMKKQERKAEQLFELFNDAVLKDLQEAAETEPGMQEFLNNLENDFGSQVLIDEVLLEINETETEKLVGTMGREPIIEKSKEIKLPGVIDGGSVNFKCSWDNECIIIKDFRHTNSPYPCQLNYYLQFRDASNKILKSLKIEQYESKILVRKEQIADDFEPFKTHWSLTIFIAKKED